MIVVPTKILVNQTAERFQQFAPDLEVGKLYTEAHDITRPVTITTYASLVRHIEDGTLDARLYKLLVLDEVHRSLSGKRSQAITQFTNAIKLGFTATPVYSEDKNVANLLNTEIHKMTIKEAVEEDLLSPFSAIIAKTEVDLTNISIKSNGDYDDDELEEAINIQSRNQAAIDLYLKLFHGQTAIAYCNSVKHAQDVAKLFSENGISAGFVSGYQDKKEQTEILKKYHEGEIQVLCNANLLIEGFDEPRVSVCLNLRPTKSIVVAQQRAGRTLRKDPDNPHKHAVIVDFLDKTDDPRKLSVTFAEVAEAAQILTKRVQKAADTNDTLNSNLTDTLSNNLSGTSDSDLIEDIFDFEEDVISISGLEVIVNPQEVMRIVKEIQGKQYQPAPDGWTTQHTIYQNSSISQRFVKLRAQRYRIKHPEWFRLFKHPNGLILEYCSPEFISAIEDEFPKIAPKDWQNTFTLAQLIIKSSKSIKRMLDGYREKHPEWFRFYSSLHGKMIEFYSPELIGIIKSTVEKQEKAPIGWKTATSLVSSLEKAQRTIAIYANNYRKEHPKWFKKYLTKVNTLTEFYSPELIECLRIEFSKLGPAPEGWLTITLIAPSLHKSPTKIMALAQSYRESHSEWIGTYLNKYGKAYEFYSPELVEQIKKDLGIDNS